MKFSYNPTCSSLILLISALIISTQAIDITSFFSEEAILQNLEGVKGLCDGVYEGFYKFQ